MEKEFIEKMRIALEDLKREILNKLTAENSEFRALVEDIDPKDLVDLASDDIDRKTLEALGSQELKRLRLIDAALARIENGKYGICMKCNKKIPQERLQAIPYAILCVDCKNSDERRNR
ncbi:MAG TPA: TraR/DksA family transcriptional regulator [Spirochaetales bacterium]|nr:TraR/DksA family transcriptional regulator [Spirochaetales bacterium]